MVLARSRCVNCERSLGTKRKNGKKEPKLAALLIERTQTDAADLSQHISVFAVMLYQRLHNLTIVSTL